MRRVMKTRIRGLYKRGNTFWFAHQKEGRRFFVSLKTDDYVQAVQKASVFLRTPSLNPTQGLRPDIEAFLNHQREHHLFTAATADSKGAILRKFGEWIGWLDTASITAEDIQRFYDEQRQMIKEGSAQTYVMALRSFFSWAVKQKLARVNPVAEVNVGRVVSTPRRRFCTFTERDQIIAGAPTPELKFAFCCGFHGAQEERDHPGPARLVRPRPGVAPREEDADF
ncbi:MAG: site-specific integrase [Bryobacterales bacterium]|nr:site-specific integrase [Bryobacterales bacterium]